MAISIRGNAGAWSTSTTTTHTVTLPTHAAGDMLIVRVAIKPYTATITTASSGWAAVADARANGSTANANGAGSLNFRAFWKIATSAAETDPVIDYGADANPAVACAVAYQLGAGEEWVTPTGDGGGDGTPRDPQTATIATHVSVTAGDMVDFYFAWCDNSGTPTVPTITQTSVTYDTVAEQPATAIATADGFDAAADGGYRLATAGTSSAAAVVTASFGASEQGGAWQTRLRVRTATSANAEVATATGAANADTANIEARGTGASAGTGEALNATGVPGTRAAAEVSAATGEALDATADTSAGAVTFDAECATGTALAIAVNANIAAALGFAQGRSA